MDDTIEQLITKKSDKITKNYPIWVNIPLDLRFFIIHKLPWIFHSMVYFSLDLWIRKLLFIAYACKL